MGLASVLLLALLASLQLTAAERYRRTVSYEDQLVIKCDFANKHRVQALLRKGFVDPWGRDKDGRLHFRVSVDLWEEERDEFPECTVAIENVEEYVQKMELDMRQKRESTKGLTWFEEYHTLEEIITWYQDVAANNPETVTYVESIGQSYEDRDTPAIHITRAQDKSTVKRIYFLCLMHSREWVSGSMCMYMTDYLCKNYGTNPNVTRILDELEFVLVPISNPDGYVYTWTKSRLWRKGRGETSVQNCHGTDLNRNFNVHWAEEGSSPNPCSILYHGRSPASEPEIVNIVNYFKANAPIIGAIDWHAFSQLILRPWAWTQERAPEEERMAVLGDTMRDLIHEVHGSNFTSGVVSEVLYFVSGGSTDWFYSNETSATNKGFRAASLAMELRDQGEYGFRLPPEQIIPSGEEIMPAVLYFAESLLDNPLLYPSADGA